VYGLQNSTDLLIDDKLKLLLSRILTDKFFKMLAMKHCTKCGRQYDDPSLKYCTEDGTPLTPHVDAEATTIKIPELTDLDLVMEISDHLKRLSIRPGENVLVRFEELQSLDPLKTATLHQIRKNIASAVQQAGPCVGECH
jgi:hypothetical protein